MGDIRLTILQQYKAGFGSPFNRDYGEVDSVRSEKASLSAIRVGRDKMLRHVEAVYA